MLQIATSTETSALSPRQTAALPYVASEATVADGARAAQIARCTLVRWMRDPAFRAEVERIRQNIADLAYSEIEGATLKGVFRIVQLLDHKDPGVRLRAGKTILATAMAARRDKDLALRLETLDQAITLLRKQS